MRQDPGLYWLLLAALLTPAPVAAQAAEDPQLEDAAGDARWYTTSDLARGARQPCSALGKLTTRACGAVETPVPREGGLPAPPMLDILEGRFFVRDAELVLELSVAGIEGPMAPHGVGDELSYFAICWDVGDAFCRDGFGVVVYHINGTEQHDSSFFRGDQTCQKVTYCYFEPRFEIVRGAPGLLRWSIAVDALPPDTPSQLVAFAASGAGALASAPHSAGYAYNASAGDTSARGFLPSMAMTAADVAGPTEPFALALQLTSAWPPPGTRWRADAAEDVPAHRDDLDILTVEVDETERDFTVRAQLARVDEAPLDHAFTVDLTLTTGATVTAGYVASGGSRSLYSGVCDVQCGPAPSVPLQRPAHVEVVAGTPGWVNVTFARFDLGNPGPGDTFGNFLVAALVPEAVEERRTPVGGARTYAFYAGDFVYDMPPWWFQLGVDRNAATLPWALSLEDAAGDTASPIQALRPQRIAADLAPFDILSLKAGGRPGGIFRVELGIQDLSSVAPPPGYDAVFYAVAFSTLAGPIMTGYYDEPATQLRAFFCAPDTAVLTSPVQDARDVVWQQIDGQLSIVRDRGAPASGGATTGSLVFLVPASCFGLQPHEDLHAEVVGGGTFIVSSAGVERIDGIQGDAPVTIAALLDVEPWYVSPFGIDGFWDIGGILLALGASGLGVIALQRKRGALKRYLHEIEQVFVDHAADTRARERALLLIQRRLKQDLLKDKITESHFVIVERRLDVHLAKVRVQALADAFGDLPYRLLVMLQELLQDGAMDPEDWRLFRTHLEAEPHLTEESRERILRRVEAWVRAEATNIPVNVVATH